MPPTPPPGGMHVVVVHFPIALLFVAPVFVLLGAITGLRSMMISALILMTLGVAAAFVATSTGTEAMDYMDDFPVEGQAYDDAYEVLDQHELQATYARNLFTGMTVLYAGVVLLTTFAKPMAKAAPRILLNLVFLGLWAYPVTQLANAAHDGGRLVHQYGLQAPLAETAEVEEGEEVLEEDEVDVTDEGDEDVEDAAETPAEAEAEESETELEAVPAE